MNYELANKIKDAGFPNSELWIHTDNEMIPSPTLEELIMACGENFAFLAKADDGDEWKALAYDYLKAKDKSIEANATTPTEAVARLWLALQKSS